MKKLSLTLAIILVGASGALHAWDPMDLLPSDVRDKVRGAIAIAGRVPGVIDTGKGTLESGKAAFVLVQTDVNAVKDSANVVIKDANVLNKITASANIIDQLFAIPRDMTPFLSNLATMLEKIANDIIQPLDGNAASTIRDIAQKLHEYPDKINSIGTDVVKVKKDIMDAVGALAIILQAAGIAR